MSDSITIGRKLFLAIDENLGWELAGNLRKVRDNEPHILDCNSDLCIVTCTENDKPYIDAMVELIGKDDDNFTVKVIVTNKKARAKRGEGFGDNCWRYNTKHKGIELSFKDKPTDNTRNKMKELGFRWSHLAGVWYISVKKGSDDNIVNFLSQFNHVQDI